MRKFFTILVLVPLGVLFLAFAIANRSLVTVSFDPFGSNDPAAGATMPLFLVIVIFAVLGVLAGGVASWFRQGHWRRAARNFEADATHARAELADLRARIATTSRQERQATQYAIDARKVDPRSLPAPQSGPSYGPSGQDKSGANV